MQDHLYIPFSLVLSTADQALFVSPLVQYRYDEHKLWSRKCCVRWFLWCPVRNLWNTLILPCNHITLQPFLKTTGEHPFLSAVVCSNDAFLSISWCSAAWSTSTEVGAPSCPQFVVRNNMFFCWGQLIPCFLWGAHGLFP